ncbi:hypothetical protein CFAEC_09285 [Corynebacterium faecale]|uniref:hypothetical protein n=1 Tax=Corynebacterium faecale TaxID=1758466 RepID=UPI0025B53104|nr:hypothetical protein [Corynebacterium faecale]WJY92674.1 hypothetical protein CFAEC_09285 [Corynebacterium faecale]
MFIAAIVLSAIGFILLVVTVLSDSQIWTWLLILTVSAGLLCFGIDEWRTRQAGRSGKSQRVKGSRQD